jgi:hypothetical protein
MQIVKHEPFDIVLCFLPYVWFAQRGKNKIRGLPAGVNILNSLDLNAANNTALSPKDSQRGTFPPYRKSDFPRDVTVSIEMVGRAADN